MSINSHADYETLNSNKQDFGQIYDSSDPRTYFRTLGGLDYIIPHVAQRIFLQLVHSRARLQQRPVTVLDLGCSYGMNGALLKYNVGWDTLYDRYAGSAMTDCTARDVVNLDRAFYASWPRRENITVLGVDVAPRAVRFAQSVGAIDRGFVLDLEREEPTSEIAETLADVDLIISTGCVGYTTSKTFARLARISKAGEPAWVASFVLRMFPYDDIAATLARQGLVTEKLEGATFVQRRFASPQEMAATVEAVRARGIPTDGFEDEGLMHAEFFLSRPADEIAAQPLTSMISISSGINRPMHRPTWLAGKMH